MRDFTVVSLLATHICFVYCVITAVQNVRLPLFPIGYLASNQIHNKLRNVMATANEFVSGVDFEAILFLFQTQSNCVCPHSSRVIEQSYKAELSFINPNFYTECAHVLTVRYF